MTIQLAHDRILAAPSSTAFPVVVDYVAKSAASFSAFKRSRQSLTGGTTGNLRFFRPYPLYFAAGQGPRMTDIDGRSYIDMFMSNGPTMLGHRHPSVEAEIEKHWSTGSLVVNPELATMAAEAVQRMVPCAERVRFLNTGTEAVLSAVRYARAFTGKSKIVKFAGHYHGQMDQFMAGVGSESGVFSEGVPASATVDTLLLPFNNLEAVKDTIAARDDIAAFILDPSMHAGGLWGAKTEYLVGLREMTREAGILLIFDEVITGFRLAPGGAQQYFGVTPDLVTLGKALAAGEKLSAVAGRADVMAVVDPYAARGARVFQSGTSNDGTFALAAAVAALREYERIGVQGYAELAARTVTLADGMRSIFTRHGIANTVNMVGPMLQLFIGAAPTGLADTKMANDSARELLLLAILNEGELLTLPSSNHIYLSFAHTDAEIGQMLTTIERAITRYDLTGDRLSTPRHALGLEI